MRGLIFAQQQQGCPGYPSLLGHTGLVQKRGHRQCRHFGTDRPMLRSVGLTTHQVLSVAHPCGSNGLRVQIIQRCLRHYYARPVF